jgi:diadenosine tetraphosphate (Ap4A) HIT family hydrolase
VRVVGLVLSDVFVYTFFFVSMMLDKAMILNSPFSLGRKGLTGSGSTGNASKLTDRTRFAGHVNTPQPEKPTFISKVLKSQSVEKALFEDEHMAVLMNIDPARHGHAMVASKRPVKFWAELNEEEYASLGRLTTLYQQFWSALPINKGKTFNYVLFTNDGPIAGQSVPHYHQQILPIEKSQPIGRGELRHFLALQTQNTKDTPITPEFKNALLDKVYGYLNQQVDLIHQFARSHGVKSTYSKVKSATNK